MSKGGMSDDEVVQEMRRMIGFMRVDDRADAR